jgi:hypothetical protein
LRTWGFEPQCSGSWKKLTANALLFFGLGKILRSRTEFTPSAPVAGADHSRRMCASPELNQHIEALYVGPYLELFAVATPAGPATANNSSMRGSNPMEKAKRRRGKIQIMSELTNADRIALYRAAFGAAYLGLGDGVHVAGEWKFGTCRQRRRP